MHKGMHQSLCLPCSKACMHHACSWSSQASCVACRAWQAARAAGKETGAVTHPNLFVSKVTRGRRACPRHLRSPAGPALRSTAGASPPAAAAAPALQALAALQAHRAMGQPLAIHAARASRASSTRRHAARWLRPGSRAGGGVERPGRAPQPCTRVSSPCLSKMPVVETMVMRWLPSTVACLDVALSRSRP